MTTPRTVLFGCCLSTALLGQGQGQKPATPEPATANGDLRTSVNERFQAVHASRRESQWQLIPWRASLAEALREAKKTNKPVYMFAADGNMQTGNC